MKAASLVVAFPPGLLRIKEETSACCDAVASGIWLSICGVGGGGGGGLSHIGSRRTKISDGCCPKRAFGLTGDTE